MELFSEGISRITGYESPDFASERVRWTQTLCPDDPAGARAAGEAGVRADRPFQVEYRIRHRDGTERWIWGQGQAVFGERSDPVNPEGFITDITAHNRTEQALADANKRLAAHLDNSPLAVIEFDSGFRIVLWSAAAERLFGWTAAEVLGLAVTGLRWVHEDDLDGTRRLMAEMQAGQRPRNQHVNRNYRKDGSVVHCAWYNSAIYDDQGGLASILSQALDVTERQRAQEALEQARCLAERRAADLEAVLQAVPAAVWIAHDPECRSISGNRTANEWLRLPTGAEASLTAPEDARPTHFKVRHDGRDLTADELPVQQAARGIEVRDFEEEIVFADGSVRPTFGHAAPMWDDQGRPRGAVAAFVDITERKRAEAALRESRERLDLALEAAQAGYWDWDLASGRASCAAECYALWGVAPGLEDLDAWLRVVHPEDRDRVSESWRDAAASGVDLNLEFRVEHPGSGTRWLAVRGRTIRDEVGRPVRMSGLSLDITERRQSEEALRKSQAQLRALVEQAPICIAMFDRRMDYLAASRRWVADYGRGHADLVGLNHYDIHPDLPDEWKRAHREALAGAFLKNDDDLWTQADGSRHWLRWAVHPWTNEAGAIGGLIISAEDITERKLAEEALRDSQADLNRAQAVGHIGSWRLDLRRNELTWSAENHRIFGIPQGTPLTYESFLDRVHPEDRAYVDRMWQAALRGYPYDIEHRLIVDGRVAWVRERANLELGTDGDVLGGFGTTQDITELKQAEEKLRVQLDLIHAITACAAGAIFVTDGDGRTTFANAEVERLLGFTSDELLGQVLHDCIHHHHPDGRPYPFGDCPNCRIYGPRKAVRDCEAVFFRKDGSPVVVLCSNSALEVDGERMGAVLVAQDITGLKRAEEALREADRRKDEFLATLAHELRNPLTPIRNAVEVLRLKTPPDPTLQAAQGLIERQLRYLVRLVDDLLDVGRITRGRLHLRRERVELAEVLAQALEASQPHLAFAGHQLTISLPPEPVYLDADPMRLGQVFLNLLNNACKYTEQGGRIGLTAWRDGMDVVVKVADTGIGIPPEHLPHLFEMFAQFGTTPEHTPCGLGIGLSLARGLVEMHGGSIEARSEGSGKGAEFTVRLPISAAMPAGQPPPGAGDELKPAAGRRILVVDDHSDVIESLAILLRVTGHEVETARDGLEAVAAAARCRPDVVLLDIGIPGLDGYAVCRRIREQPWGEDMAIIALSGWGRDEDCRRTKEAGFDAHLVKPVEPAVLLGLIEGRRVRKG